MKRVWFWLAAGVVSAQTVDFQREIRPILSDNCFQCHGPDSETRMANLRLDVKESVLERAIVAGKPAESKLYQRITAEQRARRMPPESSHKSLTPAQIAKLKLWIEQGAPWKEHWAFKAPVQAMQPAVKNPAWAANPIDRFILAKLDAVGLTPAPMADRRTLIRRVALDLTGLPPMPAEIDVYIKDASPNAYEHMVDRYLASPHYGEQRARFWLDAARYADTHGIHIDNYREIWPYRDWVIQAYNRNMPYRQFATEQLAGDLLPAATLDQRIATGFIRCGVTTNEAGIIEDEYAEIYAKDRAETFSAIFLGMTTGCATCHDHKFDPITQKDFYSLGAFFRNTTQRVMDDNVPDPPPLVVVPKQEDRATWTKVTARLKDIRAEMDQAASRSDAAFRQWLAERSTTTLNSPFDDASELFSPDLAAAVKSGKDVDLLDGAIHFQKNTGVEVAGAPKLDAGKPFSVSVHFYFPKAEQGYTIVAHSDKKDRNRGWLIDVGGRVPGMRITGDNGKSIEIRAAHLVQLVPGSWNNIVAAYDGSRQQQGLSFYLNGRAVATQGRGNQVTELPGDIEVETPLTLGRSFEGGSISDLRIFNRVVTESEAKLLNDWPRIRTGDEAALRTYYLQRLYEPYKLLAAEQADLNIKANKIARRGSVSLVMEERTDAKPKAWILYRGAYDQRREQVDANTPAVLPPMRSNMERNRLGLARWLFTEDHPLTARVAVNRMWQEIFGIGLAKTAEDFGSQGEPPVNQELLDWLAVDFRDHGWDIKRFYKQIVMSSTYRQSAAVTQTKLEKDPEDRLLSRAPRFRMDAEMVRDYALSASGLLAGQIGGPSVKPYQPEGVWEAVAMDGSNTRFYKQDSGVGLYRRSMYWFWKRSAPPASLDIFNAPTRENCTVRRERTDTPLQALVTMNDVQFVEAARELAQRSMQMTVDFDTQLEFIATRILVRPLTPAEKVIAKKSYEHFREYYSSHEADAREFLNQGERKGDPALPPAELASMAMLASQLLNLDEVLNK